MRPRRDDVRVVGGLRAARLLLGLMLAEARWQVVQDDIDATNHALVSLGR